MSSGLTGIPDDRPTWLRKILPVLLPGSSKDEIPLFLLPDIGTRYHVPDLTQEGTDDLLRVRTGQPRYVAPALARVPDLPPVTLPDPPDVDRVEDRVEVGAQTTGPADEPWHEGTDVQIAGESYLSCYPVPDRWRAPVSRSRPGWCGR